ncbi:MAG: HAMP domain-containing protein [Clostridiales bacterium]|nr:HAMP domain-containing protein [Clostridiales bacterium]
MKAKISIQRKLTIFTMTAFLLPLAVWMVFAFSIMNERLYDTRITAAQNTLDHIGGDISRIMESCELSADQFSSDRAILNLVWGRNEDRDVVGVYLQKIAPLVTSIKLQNPAVKTIHIVHENETIFNLYDIFYRVDDIDEYISEISSNLTRAQQQIIRYYSTTPDYNFFADAHDAETGVNSSQDGCWYVRGIMNIYKMYLPCGVVEIVVDNDALYAGMDRFERSNGDRLCLMLNDGTMIHGDEMPENAGERRSLKNMEGWRDDSTIALTYALPDMEAQLVYAMSINSFSMTGAELRVLMLLMVFSLIIMLLLTRLVSRALFKRLTKLSDQMDAIGHLDPQAAKGILGGDEIDRLNEHFSQMLDRMERANEIEKQLIFNDLTNDLKPHLICNAMDMMNLQAERAKQPQIACSVRQISQYFRYSMLRDKNGVTLLSEVDDARNYLELINAMRESKVYMDVQLDEWSERNAGKLIVPKMILQPLVDNALRHGIQASNAGLIRIRLRYLDGNLEVKVEDNGEGMSRETEEMLRSAIAGNPKWESKRRHVGIANVIMRMNIFFPGQYTLDFVTSPNEGSIFTLTFLSVGNNRELQEGE